jgi:hypothetical protein
MDGGYLRARRGPWAPALLQAVDATPKGYLSFSKVAIAHSRFPRRTLLGSSVNKSGPEHVLYVVQAGPNRCTQRSYDPTLLSTLGPGLRTC